MNEVAKSDAIADEMYELIAARSDGVPLYVEEVTKDLVESGLLSDGAGPYTMGDASRQVRCPAPCMMR